MAQSYLECTLSQGGFASCTCPDCCDARSSQFSPLGPRTTPFTDVARSTSLSPSWTPSFKALADASGDSETTTGTKDSPVDLTFDEQEDNQEREPTLTITFPFDNPRLRHQRQALHGLDPNNSRDHTVAAMQVKPLEIIDLDLVTPDDYEGILQQKDDTIAELSARLSDQNQAIADRGADHLQAMWHKDRIIAIRKRRIRDLEIREQKLEKDMRWSKDNGYDLREENKWLKKKLLEAYQKLDEDAREQAETRARNGASKENVALARFGDSLKHEGDDGGEIL